MDVVWRKATKALNNVDVVDRRNGAEENVSGAEWQAAQQARCPKDVCKFYNLSVPTMTGNTSAPNAAAAIVGVTSTFNRECSQQSEHDEDVANDVGRFVTSSADTGSQKLFATPSPRSIATNSPRGPLPQAAGGHRIRPDSPEVLRQVREQDQPNIFYLILFSFIYNFTFTPINLFPDWQPLEPPPIDIARPRVAFLSPTPVGSRRRGRGLPTLPFPQ